MTQVYYRLQDSRTFGFGDELHPTISCVKFKVIKETPKGVWITPEWDYGDYQFKRFVLHGAGKRYAYPTFEQALDNYKRRKKWHTRHLAHQLRMTEQRMEIMETLTLEKCADTQLQIEPWLLRGMPAPVSNP